MTPSLRSSPMGRSRASWAKSPCSTPWGRIPAKRVVVAGLGKSGDFDAAAVRRVSDDVARFLRRKGVSEFATIAHGAGIGGLDAGESAQAIAEGTLLGLYKFDTYRSPPRADNGNDDSGGDNGGIESVNHRGAGRRQY